MGAVVFRWHVVGEVRGKVIGIALGLTLVEAPMTFNRAVFWSGVWNVGLGLILVTPPIREFLGVHIPNPFWPWIIAAFLWYTSATLILSSRDVQNFASIIYWEAPLRFAAVIVLIAYGLTYVGVSTSLP
jgi:hypothetical protein